MILSNEIEKTTGSGNTFNLSSNNTSAEVIASYLRTIHGRNDLSIAMNQIKPNFESEIEKIRVHLNSSNLIEAEDLLNNISSNTVEEFLEIQLENSRLQLFKGNYNDACHLAREAFNQAKISPTKMTLAQLLGDIYLKLGNFEKAEYYLDIAIEIGNHFPLLSATWSAHAFKIIHFLKTNKIREAKLKLEKFYSAAKEIKGDAIVDRLIIVLRTEFHYHRKVNELSKCTESLTVCNELCKWNGDFHTKKRNDLELENLPVNEISSIYYFTDWTFLPKINLILNFEPKSVVNLEGFPIIVEFLRLLSIEKRELSFEEIFFNLKGQTYNPEIHLAYIKNIIQRSRKKLPKNSLIVKNNLVSLI